MDTIKMYIVLMCAREAQLEDWYDSRHYEWLPFLRSRSATYRYYVYRQIISLAKKEYSSPYFRQLTVDRLMCFAEQIKELG